MNKQENVGQCVYEHGRFSLNKDGAIIDELGDFPPIIIAPNYTDDGSEPNCADRRGVLHLLNELSDNNPNEEKHWYLKKMLDKSWKQYHEQKEENEQLKEDLEYKERVIKQYQQTQEENMENCQGDVE